MGYEVIWEPCREGGHEGDREGKSELKAKPGTWRRRDHGEAGPRRETRAADMFSCLIRQRRGLNGWGAEGLCKTVTRCSHARCDLLLASDRGPGGLPRSQALACKAHPAPTLSAHPADGAARSAGQRTPSGWKDAPRVPHPQVGLPKSRGVPRLPRGHEGSHPQETASLGRLLAGAGLRSTCA